MNQLLFIIEPLHILCFYVFFFIQNRKDLHLLNQHRIFKLILGVLGLLAFQFLIMFFAAETWLSIFCTNIATIPLLMLITYFCLHSNHSEKYTLRIRILFSMSGFMFIQIMCAFFDRYFEMFCQAVFNTTSMLPVIFIHNIFELGIILALGFIDGKLFCFSCLINDQHRRNIYYTILSIFLVTYIILSGLTFTQRLYDHIIDFLLFLIIELLIYTFLYVLINKYEEEKTQNDLITNELQNLKTYTSHLEKEQRKLRKFKHDYENMVLSLEEILAKDNSQNSKEYLDAFKQYSDQYLKQSNIWKYNDIDNVKSEFLKSILISKITQAIDKGIHVHFECRYPVTKTEIKSYDLVRIIGIICDNAIEEVNTLPKEARKINILIYAKDNQTEISITNPVASKKDLAAISHEGVTTKKQHQGLGLANLQQIIDNYPKALLTYFIKDDWFNVKIII